MGGGVWRGGVGEGGRVGDGHGEDDGLFWVVKGFWGAGPLYWKGFDEEGFGCSGFYPWDFASCLSKIDGLIFLLSSFGL